MRAGAPRASRLAGSPFYGNIHSQFAYYHTIHLTVKNTALIAGACLRLDSHRACWDSCPGFLPPADRLTRAKGDEWEARAPRHAAFPPAVLQLRSGRGARRRASSRRAGARQALLRAPARARQMEERRTAAAGGCANSVQNAAMIRGRPQRPAPRAPRRNPGGRPPSLRSAPIGAPPQAQPRMTPGGHHVKARPARPAHDRGDLPEARASTRARHSPRDARSPAKARPAR